jgi:hypothetical protein
MDNSQLTLADFHHIDDSDVVRKRFAALHVLYKTRLFHKAINGCSSSVAKAMIEEKADINLNVCGDQALSQCVMTACHKSEFNSVVYLLVESRADVNATGLCNQTTLHRMSRYYQDKNKLPPSWTFSSRTERLLV